MNTTYSLLRAYAIKRYTLTVAGTIAQLTGWFEREYGVRIAERTFKRHTRQLADAGLIEVWHRRGFASYTLLDFEVKMPRYRFELVSSGESGSEYRAVEDGYEILTPTRVWPERFDYSAPVELPF